VYGSNSESAYNEKSEKFPVTPYGKSKNRAEKHVLRLSEKKKTFIVRAGNIYGYNPCLRWDAVINKFMLDAQYRGSVEIHGTGEQQRAFIHIEDISDFLIQYINPLLTMPKIVNAVSSNFSVIDIVDNIRKLYKNLDTIYINQHLKMRSVSVDTIFPKLAKFGNVDFEKNLLLIKDSFRF
jgi:UDP-glucose 4-epimerase